MNQAEEVCTPIRLGVVTVTFNSASVLPAFLHSTFGQTCEDFRLYAVDNASRDETPAMLAAVSDTRMRTIFNDGNLGIAEANNQGTRAALSDGCTHVLFLNNDIEFSPDTFAMLLQEMDWLACDLLGPKIWYGDGVHIWSAGGGFLPAKGCLGFHRGQDEVDHGQFEVAMRTDHTPACCLLVRASVFETIGMMDAKYFVYYDDVDFSYRARKAGLTTYYTPSARILHRVSSLTGGPKSVFTTRYNVRGHVYFMLKNLGLLRCLFFLPAWELRLLYKLLRRQIDTSEFAVRQSAFFEGIGVWLS